MLLISAVQALINEEIHEKEVRVIGSDGGQVGLMSSEEALKIADEEGLDLVLISPNANPPVCRIMDYGKYRFEQSKKEKEAKKNQKVVEIKEIKMTVNIDTNDYNTKVAQAIKFLKNGDKVKLTVRYRRARELSHTNLGEALMQRFMESVAEYGFSEKPCKLEGRNYAAVLSPRSAQTSKKKPNKPQSDDAQKNEN